MRIVTLEIQNFRGIKHSKITFPEKRILCLVGAGDSTKSTLLEAIRWNLLQGWVINVTDSDFYKCNTEEPIIIRGTYTEIPDTLISEEKYGFFLRSGKAVAASFERQDSDFSWMMNQKTLMICALQFSSPLKRLWNPSGKLLVIGMSRRR